MLQIERSPTQTSMYQGQKTFNLQTGRCPTQTHKYQEQETEQKTINCSDGKIPNSNPQISRKTRQMPNSNPRVSRAGNSAKNLEFFELIDVQLKPTNIKGGKLRRKS
jgi:hypothetical protein